VAAHPRLPPPHHQHVKGSLEHSRLREGPKWPAVGERSYRLLWTQGQHLHVDVCCKHDRDGSYWCGHDAA
jgi:hypothetical protein